MMHENVPCLLCLTPPWLSGDPGGGLFLADLFAFAVSDISSDISISSAVGLTLIMYSQNTAPAIHHVNIFIEAENKLMHACTQLGTSN